MNDMLSSLTSTRPLSRQCFIWGLLSLLITLLFAGACYAFQRWVTSLPFTMGQQVELMGFVFFFTLTLLARTRAKQAALSRQFLNLMEQSLTRTPNATTQAQFKTLQTVNNVNLGFALLIFRLANGMFKLFLFIFLIHSIIRWIF